MIKKLKFNITISNITNT